ncbi:MAG TPA: hypothetical protein EYQ61_12415 [Dehalococcoidia bacterium]|jgi:hypothetical protein|nr:hypothetical protein [Dehalococcoidia bacterium]HIK88297.1 hypothetical protein [Dehalococcoidia bacterium]
MGTFYENSVVPDHLKREFNVYDRIKELNVDLGLFDDNVASLKGAGICGIIFHESGLVYLSGHGVGPGQMYDDPDRIKEGQDAAEWVANSMIKRLHWALTCGGEGGDLNDVIYTVKAIGMVVSTDVAFNGGPAVMNGFSEQWQSVFGGGKGKFAVDGEDESYSGVHARSAIGGFTGRFSIEPEIIVAIPPELAKAIIQNRGWVFPLPPAMLDKVKADQG